MIVVCNAGCLSSIGASTLGTAGGNAPVAFSRSGVGKGESYWLAQYDDVVEATVRAGEVLSLTVAEKKIEEDQAFFRFSDDKAKRINLFIQITYIGGIDLFRRAVFPETILSKVLWILPYVRFLCIASLTSTSFASTSPVASAPSLFHRAAAMGF